MESVEFEGPREYWTPVLCHGDLPPPRSGHTAVLYKERYMYVIGGITKDTPLNDIHCLDFKTLTWSKLQANSVSMKNVPSGRCSHASVLDEHCGFIYVFGGTGFPFGQANKNDTFVYDIPSNSWVEITCSGTLPEARYGHSLCLYQEHLLLFGGTTGWAFSNDLHMLFLPTKTWSRLKTQGIAPAPRYKHAVVIHENSMLIIGGTSIEVYGDVYSLNLFTLQWTSISGLSLDEGRFSHSVEIFRSFLYLFGGCGQSRKSEMWKYSLKKNVWIQMLQEGERPPPLNFHTSVFYKGTIMLFGGNTGTTKLNTITGFRLSDYVPSFVSPISYLLKYIENTGYTSDCKILFSSECLYTQYAVIKTRVPLLAQHAVRGRELASECEYFLSVDFRVEVGRLLLLYVYKDEVDATAELGVLLELFSVASVYGIADLLRKLYLYITHSLNDLNVARTLSYLYQNLEGNVLHQTEYSKNLQLFRDAGSPQYLMTADLTLAHSIQVYCLNYIALRYRTLKKIALFSQLPQSAVSAITELRDSKSFLQPSFSAQVAAPSSLAQCLSALHHEPSKSFKIRTEDSALFAHSFMLYASSQFFESIIEHNPSNPPSEVDLSHMPTWVVQQVLNYIYLGPAGISELSVELLPHADFLQLRDSSVREHIGSLVSSSLTTESAIQTLLYAEQVNSKSMKYTTIGFIMSHFQEIAQREELVTLSPALFVEIIRWRAAVERSKLS